MIPFRTVTGRRVDLEHPRPKDVDLRDIACGLSKICRFTGQLRRFYSVAQHSIFVAELMETPRLRRAALLHDASEAYLNDLNRNLKHSKYLQGYRILEARWRETIRIGLECYTTDTEDVLIKCADDLAAIWERVELRQHLAWEIYGPDEIDRCVGEGWVRSDAAVLHRLARRVVWPGPGSLPPDAAEELFLRRYKEYAR